MIFAQHPPDEFTIVVGLTGAAGRGEGNVPALSPLFSTRGSTVRRTSCLEAVALRGGKGEGEENRAVFGLRGAL